MYVCVCVCVCVCMCMYNKRKGERSKISFHFNVVLSFYLPRSYRTQNTSKEIYFLHTSSQEKNSR